MPLSVKTLVPSSSVTILATLALAAASKLLSV
nr:MAG TPA: hypothetical protein [Caudoviricetes sp.]